MPLTVTVSTIAECLRTDCNILGDDKKLMLQQVYTNGTFYRRTEHGSCIAWTAETSRDSCLPCLRQRLKKHTAVTTGL